MSVMQSAPQKPLLFSLLNHHYCHRIRLFLLEKDIEHQVVFIDEEDDEERNADFLDLNPYGTAPFYIDRDVRLYHTNTLLEYLDQRYRQTRLYQENIIDQAKQKQNLWRIEHDWFRLADILLSESQTLTPQAKQHARTELQHIIMTLMPIFKEYTFFLSEQFSILDCAILPILYRYKALGLEFPVQKCKPLLDYMTLCFNRPAFKKSVSWQEEALF